ncbi:MAG: signal peptidase II [Firmicutes bacterium]|nr:signal peptidase II [Bacillota bacterium]
MMKKYRYLLVIGIIVLDQVVKLMVRSSMFVGQSIPVIDGIFHLTYVQNRGAAFSILYGQNVFLIFVPTIAVLLAIWYMEKHLKEHWTMILALSLLVSGGIGNLIDRGFFGFVTDMFDFRIWPVFNVADIAVCVGAGFLILYTFLYTNDSTAIKETDGESSESSEEISKNEI